jgi:hypothetical protein
MFSEVTESQYGGNGVCLGSIIRDFISLNHQAPHPCTPNLPKVSLVGDRKFAGMFHLLWLLSRSSVYLVFPSDLLYHWTFGNALTRMGGYTLTSIGGALGQCFRYKARGDHIACSTRHYPSLPKRWYFVCWF